jgi:hypothetical protein
MTKKKRRRRPPPLRQPEARPSGPAPARATRRDQAAVRPRRPRTPEERRAQAAQWVHPPVAITAAKGLGAVGGSPVLLIAPFLVVLALWLGFSAYGVALAVTPGFMGMLQSLPPVHVLLLDIQALYSGGTVSPARGVFFVAVLLLVRAALTGFWIALMVDRFRPRSESESSALPGPVGGWKTEVSRAAARTGRTFGALVGIEAGFFTVSMATSFLSVNGLGSLPVIIWLIGGLYFFVFTPIVAVVEGAGARAATELAIRAARMPGPRHMMATTVYVALALVVSLAAPPSRVAEATPSIVVWVFVLFVTFVNMAALATFTYRWLMIRDRVLAAPAGRQRGDKQERPAPAPLR